MIVWQTKFVLKITRIKKKNCENIYLLLVIHINTWDGVRWFHDIICMNRGTPGCAISGLDPVSGWVHHAISGPPETSAMNWMDRICSRFGGINPQWGSQVPTCGYHVLLGLDVMPLAPGLGNPRGLVSGGGWGIGDYFCWGRGDLLDWWEFYWSGYGFGLHHSINFGIDRIWKKSTSLN